MLLFFDTYFFKYLFFSILLFFDTYFFRYFFFSILLSFSIRGSRTNQNQIANKTWPILLACMMAEFDENSELEIFENFLSSLPEILESLTEGRFERPVLEEIACRQLYHEAVDCCYLLQNFLFYLSAIPPCPTVEDIEEGLSTLYAKVYDLSNFYSERLNILTQDATSIQCPIDTFHSGENDFSRG